jgi:hypothetical protein
MKINPANNGPKDFLIFDKAELMGEIFTQAEQNIVGERL